MPEDQTSRLQYSTPDFELAPSRSNFPHGYPDDDTLNMSRLAVLASGPLIIAHRGASGLLPEHTLEAYERAISLGADALETDIVSTRDGVLLCRHESELSVTTNVADHPEFASRRARRSVDGVELSGWFAEDFTWAELKRLRCRQRFAFRDRRHDDRYSMATLGELLDLVASHHQSSGRGIGLLIEIKHATHLAGHGLALGTLLLSELERHAAGDVVLQSFEIGILKELRSRGRWPLIQLIDEPRAAPFDLRGRNDSRCYADLITPDGLREISTYADGIGVWKRLIVPAEADEVDGTGHAIAPRLAPPTPLVSDAHAAGLLVCAWTFRDEPSFLAADYQGDARREYQQFFSLGVDGVITDFPQTARAARDRD